MDSSSEYKYYEKIQGACYKKIKDLTLQYQNDKNILDKILYEINHQLPRTINSRVEILNERQNRKQLLNQKKNEFLYRFLNKRNYFYIPSTGIFVYYNKLNYHVYNEDDIQHEILSAISTNKDLHPWKYKIKKNLIKTIKHTTAIDYIPETATIQILQQYFYPTIFPNKYHTKYFLTLVGDILLKKKSEFVYIINSEFSGILKELSNYMYNYFGNNQLTNVIKVKYYSHEYNKCRLLMVNNIQKNFKFTELFYKNILDVFCISMHYSNRYGGAEEYINQCYENQLVKYTLFLKDKTPQHIVKEFINKTIQTSASTSLDMKNMLYLWKKYLQNLKIPNIINYALLKQLLKENLSYNEELEIFENITSLSLPLVSFFVEFWRECVVESPNNMYNYEADELACLFKLWLGTDKSSVIIKDDMLIELIQHFFPHIQIKDNKYILNILTPKWNKPADIETAINAFKIQNTGGSKSLNDIYKFYCKFAKEQNYIFIVSKQYFVSIINNYLNVDIDGICTF